MQRAGWRVIVAAALGFAAVDCSPQLAEEELGNSRAELVTGNLNDCRNFHAATALQSNQVLVVGGYCRDYLATAELFNPTNGTWSRTGALSTPRLGHTTTLLPSSGAVLVVGGENIQGSLATAELYNPTAATWSPAGSLSQARGYSTATLLPSTGRVLVVGGLVGGMGASATVDTYTPASASPWSLSSPLRQARWGHTATLLTGPERVLVVGGGLTERYSLNDAELYDVATGAWSPAGTMRERRMFHTATLLPKTGKILVVGGKSAPGDGGLGSALASAELYDPATKTWSLASPMAQARHHHTAVLTNGKVLVMGGVSIGESMSTPLASAELYDPETNTWTSAPALSQARTYHVAVPLPGKVVVVGGWANAPLASTESFEAAPVCGDGVTTGAESCDDGNTVSETSCAYGTRSCSACNSTCTAPLNLVGGYCGDGVTNGSETCDDGNILNENYCTNGASSCTTCNSTCSRFLYLQEYVPPYEPIGCSSSTESWSQSQPSWNGNPTTEGTYTCTGTVSAASHGGTVSATLTGTATRRGSAQFKCNDGSWELMSGTCDGTIITATTVKCSDPDPVRDMFIGWYVDDLKRCADLSGLDWWVTQYNTNSDCLGPDYKGHGSKDACWRAEFRKSPEYPEVLANGGHITATSEARQCGTPRASPWTNIRAAGSGCKHRP